MLFSDGTMRNESGAGIVSPLYNTNHLLSYSLQRILPRKGGAWLSERREAPNVVSYPALRP